MRRDEEMTTMTMMTRKIELHAKMVAMIESGKMDVDAFRMMADELAKLNAADVAGRLQWELIRGEWAGF
jgi:hypothetical protein